MPACLVKKIQSRNAVTFKAHELTALYSMQCGTLAFNHPRPPPRPSPPIVTKRVFGGTKAKSYSEPWLGQVIQQRSNICGISLIAKSAQESETLFAISSAHCFISSTTNETLPASSFGFLFGVHDLRFPSAHMVYRMAEEIIIHDGYEDRINNDVAVVKFREKVRFNSYVRPICLPEMLVEYPANDPPARRHCSICGYGMEALDEDNKPVFSSVPKCIRSNFLRSGAHLGEELFLTPQTYYLSTASRMDYKVIGEGDSGTPVSCLIDNKFTIIAVVCGISCSESPGENQFVTVFTRVPYYLQWIQNMMD